ERHWLMTASRRRQIRVGPRCRADCRSVVKTGTLQVRYTLLPLCAARRSVGGLGRSSDGGIGAPVEAQPANKAVAARADNAPYTWRRNYMTPGSMRSTEGSVPGT